MAELRLNNQGGQLASVGTDVTTSSTATTINFAVAPDFPTLTAGQTITLILDPPQGVNPSPTFEIVHLTAFTAGQTTGTVARAAEDSTNWPAVAHPVSSNSGFWIAGPTVSDFTSGGGSGTVTTVSVATANGFGGSVANPTTTPAITVTTGITGLLKGNGTAVAAATSGTDYAPGTAGNTTGLVKSTTSTGALTTAVAADVPTVAAGSTGPLSATDATTTNARTPTAHASTHAAAGSDPVSLSVSQVTGALVASNNLSDVTVTGTARFNLQDPVLTACAAVATTDQALTGLPTIDGYTLAYNATAPDHVLLTAQTTASQNGPWQVSSGGGAWTRPASFPSGGALTTGKSVSVKNGTVYAGTEWIINVPTGGLTIDTSSQTWEQTKAAGLTSTLVIASGGTGATSASTALSNLGGQAGPLTGDVTTSGAAATLVSTTNVQSVIRGVAGLTNIPAVGKLMIGGHSYAVPGDIYGASYSAVLPPGATSAATAWPALIRDATSVRNEVYVTQIQSLGAGGTSTSVLNNIDYPSILHGWSYTPVSQIAASPTAYRTLAITNNGIALATFSSTATSVGGSTPVETLLGSQSILGVTGFTIVPGHEAQFLTPGNPLYLSDTKTGTVADPGGNMVVRLMGKYWNVAVNGSQLVSSDGATYLNQGGWSTWAKLQPSPILPTVQVRATGAAVSGATSIGVDQLPSPVGGFSYSFPVGTLVKFSGGATATVAAAAITAATVSGTTVTITAAGTWQAGQIVYIAGLANGGGTNWANANSGIFGSTVVSGGTGSFTITVASNTPTGTSNNSGTALAGITNGATTLTFSGAGLSAAVSANEVGIVSIYGTNTAGGFYNLQTTAAKNGLVVLCWGINDVGFSVSELYAWKEAIRFAIAISCCPYRQYGYRNSTYSNGVSTDNTIAGTNGTGGTWAVTALPTTPVAITAASVSGTTVTITAAGTWTTGQVVNVSGLTNNAGTNWTNANGAFTITGGSGSFTYTVATNTPTSTAAVGNAYACLPSWTSRLQQYQWTGSATPSGSYVDINIPAWYDGVGAVDLFFAAPLVSGAAQGGNATITYGSAANALSPTALFSGANAGLGIVVNGGNTAGANDVIDTGSSNALTVAAGSNGQDITARSFTLNLSAAVPTSVPTSGVWWVQVGGTTWRSFTYTGVSGSTLTGCNVVDPNVTGTLATGNATDNAPSHQFDGNGGNGVGMVKRIKGLPAGGGRLRITLNAMASSTAKFIVEGWGVEASVITQPVVVCSIPYVLVPVGGYPEYPSIANIDLYNAGTTAVVAERTEGNVVIANLNNFLGTISTNGFTPTAMSNSGTTITVTTTTPPPVGKLVSIGGYISGGSGWQAVMGNQIVTSVVAGTSFTYTAASTPTGTPTVTGVSCKQVTIDPTFFSYDGLHPNDKGHAAIATSIMAAVVSNFTNEQLATK